MLQIYSQSRKKNEYRLKQMNGWSYFVTEENRDITNSNSIFIVKTSQRLSGQLVFDKEDNLIRIITLYMYCV